MKKINMVFNLYSKFIVLFLLLGCSEQSEKSNIDYSKEFNSILNTFNESSILEFDESSYLDEIFISEFLTAFIAFFGVSISG